MIAPATDRLSAFLVKSGYDFVEPPILQDADLFLDLAGEDLRRRLFLTASADGVELCLRPDYTIPVCLHHIATGHALRRAAYAYHGPVFRQRVGETGEFYQAGVESIGRTDRADADAEVVALALESVRLFGVDEPQVRIGDSALFGALLEALSIPEVWRRRLARAFGDPARLNALVDRMAAGVAGTAPAYAGFLAALEGADPRAARQIVDDLFRLAGIRPVGGRTPAEIADRFLEQAALAAGSGVSDRAVSILRRFLAITGSPAEAVMAVGELAAAEGLDLATAIVAFADRNNGLAAHGIDPDQLSFAADFGRRLDYYTGFVFELFDPERSTVGPLAGGGRYDRLLSLIVSRDGSAEDVPAVGFALWLDRLEGERP